MANPIRQDADLPHVREAVAIFDSVEKLQECIDALALSGLGVAGVGSRDISILAGDETIRERFGRTYRTIDEAKDDPNAPRETYVAPEELGSAQGAAAAIPGYAGALLAAGAIVASGGAAAAAIVGAAAAGGGAAGLGALASKWLGDKRNDWFRDHLDKGGILMWVALRDPTLEPAIVGILERYTSRPVEVHELPQPDPIPGGRSDRAPRS